MSQITLQHRTLKRTLKTIASSSILGLMTLSFWTIVPLPSSFNFADSSSAVAKSSGGKSRGGSFKRATPAPSSPKPQKNATPRPSTPRPTSKATSTPRPKITSTPRSTQTPSPQSSPTNTSAPNANPAVVPVPIPIGGGGSQNPQRNETPGPTPVGQNTPGSFPWGALILGLLILGGIVVLVIVLNSRSSQTESEEKTAEKPKPLARDLRNDVVTLTFLQIALDASARDLQAQLTTQAEQGDWESREGLTQQLQEAALAVLREEGYWRGVKVLSETLPNRDRAAQRFEELSIQERSKFSEETISRTGDRFQQRAMQKQEDDIALYIMVSFLVGTEDDQPLFTDKIYDTESLTIALQRLAQITPDYLSVFELLWSPQNSEDSLTEDELICEYSDIIMPL